MEDGDREERRRLKKIRKEQMKLSSSTEINNPDTGIERKHKKKHKCNDENCKHRRHKKRRKHKKHYHRMHDEEDNSTNSPSIENISPEDEISPDESASQTAPSNEEDKVSDDKEKSSGKDDVFNPNLREDTMTEEEIASGVTESSGSYYVSFAHSLGS